MSRTFDGTVYALANQAFGLASGGCPDDERVQVPVFAVREGDGVVEVALPR